MTQAKWDPEKYSTPKPAELSLEYDPATDILTLWDRTPASNGWDVAQGLTVFTDDTGKPHTVTLKEASRLLRLVGMWGY